MDLTWAMTSPLNKFWLGSKIIIRKGEKNDLTSVLSLIKELADYENALQEVILA